MSPGRRPSGSREIHGQSNPAASNTTPPMMRNRCIEPPTSEVPIQASDRRKSNTMTCCVRPRTALEIPALIEVRQSNYNLDGFPANSNPAESLCNPSNSMKDFPLCGRSLTSSQRDAAFDEILHPYQIVLQLLFRICTKQRGGASAHSTGGRRI